MSKHTVWAWARFYCLFPRGSWSPTLWRDQAPTRRSKPVRSTMRSRKRTANHNLRLATTSARHVGGTIQDACEEHAGPWARTREKHRRRLRMRPSPLSRTFPSFQATRHARIFSECGTGIKNSLVSSFLWPSHGHHRYHKDH